VRQGCNANSQTQQSNSKYANQGHGTTSLPVRMSHDREAKVKQTDD
jgi:hypothetical protein